MLHMHACSYNDIIYCIDIMHSILICKVDSLVSVESVIFTYD